MADVLQYQGDASTLTEEYFGAGGIRVEYQFIGQPPIIRTYTFDDSVDAVEVTIPDNTLLENGVLIHQTHVCHGMGAKRLTLASGREVRATYSTVEPPVGPGQPQRQVLWLVIVSG